MKALMRNLKNQTGVAGPHPVMWCPRCGAEYSANKGDYWDVRADHKFTCCGRTMELVYVTRGHRQVRKPAARGKR